MEFGDASVEEALPAHPNKKDLTKSLRMQIVSMLQGMENDGSLPRGSVTAIAKRFGVARCTVHRLWKRAARTCATGLINSPDFNSRKKNSGRPPIYPTEFVREGVKDVPLRKRQTQWKLATSMGVSKTTVQRWIVASTIRVHSNSLKPILTEENKLARLLMANHFRDPKDPSKFQDMRDRIHLDEKWFFLTREKERYLLVSDEKNPKRCVKHKSHITKVMFLCAVARPHFNTSANSWWDGKLGIWPIGDWEPAQWGSKNRPKGTLVWKNKMVTKVVYRDLLINKLIPAILEKWPRSNRMSRTIYIQQDGAKNHIREDDEEFNNALTLQEIDAKLYTQTPNSPDVNLLDLGFFRAIQSFNDASPKDEGELIQLVQTAYEDYPRDKLNRTWLTLQSCFNQIILHHGDNDYSIEHLSKAKLERQGQLPDVLDVVDDDVYETNDETNDESDNESNSSNTTT